jgi:hypothetical protein
MDGFELISNTQWMVVARSIEATSFNWSNNIVLSGVLNRGHSDDVSDVDSLTNGIQWSGADKILSQSKFDLSSYFGTGNTPSAAWHTLGTTPAAGQEQKRTFHLPNGSVVWDFSGNLLQWVKGSRTDIGFSSSVALAAAWIEISGLPAAEKLLIGPANASLSSSKNIGQLYGNSAGTDGISRGGSWDDATLAGIFGTTFITAASVNPWTGFRCVYIKP